MARDRTELANERTLLSYVRTTLGLIGAAIIIFRFATPLEAAILGPLCLTIAICILIWGFRNYRVMKAKINGGTPSQVMGLVEAHDL